MKHAPKDSTNINLQQTQGYVSGCNTETYGFEPTIVASPFDILINPSASRFGSISNKRLPQEINGSLGEAKVEY